MTARSIAATAWARVDGWMHYHRFSLRLVCDIHDFLMGMEIRSLFNERREGRRPHSRMSSMRRHPSMEGEAA